MNLRKSTLAVPIRGGVNNQEDAKSIGARGIVGLENGRFGDSGEPQKRNGYTPLSSALVNNFTADELSALGGVAALVLPDGRGLAVRDDELIRFGDSKAHSYLSNTDEWVEAGDIECVGLEHRGILKTKYKQVLADMATLNGVSLVTWQQGSEGLIYAVIDEATERVIVQPTVLDANASISKVYAIGNHLHCVWVDTSQNIKISIMSSSVPGQGMGASSTLYADADSSSQTIAVVSNGTYAVLAYWIASSGGIRLAYIAEDGVIGTPVRGYASPIVHATPSQTSTVGPSLAIDDPGLTDYDATQAITLAYGTGGAARWAQYGTDWTASVADSAVTGATTPVRMVAHYQRDNESGGDRRVHLFNEIAGPAIEVKTLDGDGVSAAGTGGTQLGGRIASMPWRDGPSVYLATVYESTLWTTYFVHRQDWLVVGRVLSGNAAAAPTKAVWPTVTASSRSYSTVLGYRLRVDSDDEDTVYTFTEDGIRKVTLDFNASDSHQSVQIGDALYIAGAGFLWQYDSQGFTEAGMFYAPDDVAAPSQSTGGNLTTTGVYSYRFVYGWRNSRGEIEWGPTSVGTSVTMTASNNKLTFSIPTLQHTAKTDTRSECLIGVFRTEDAKGLYYMVSSLDPTDTGDNGYVANDPTTATVSFVDVLSDANLISREPLYTTGGVLSNDGWESGKIVAVGKDRVFTNDASDADVVRYSQQLAEGRALEQPALTRVRIDQFGGDITGIAVMDDTVVVFKEHAIYGFAGPGPLANVSGGGFSDPQLITSDAGCSSQRSIAATPRGLVFQSSKGLYLLDRGRNVSYIGDRVEDYNDQTITSANLVPDTTEIRFLTSSGRTLVWDYYYDAWSTWLNHEGADAVTLGTEYYYLRNDGEVWQSDDSYEDGSRSITLAIETGWLHFPKHGQGQQRIWHLHVLGDYLSAHTLNVYYQVDYRNGWASSPIALPTTDYIDEDVYGAGDYGAGAYGGSGDIRYQETVHLGLKCEAVRFRFEDLETTVHGAAYELSELLLEGAVEAPSYTQPAGRMG